MSNMNSFNQGIITEFRANGGKVGGQFANRPLLLLTTTGARTGQPRTHPVTYLTDGDRLIIFASKGGAPTNPDWYHNLRANPIVTVELGGEQFQARATVAEGPEDERLRAKVLEAFPAFNDYQGKISRKIPLIALERIE